MTVPTNQHEDDVFNDQPENNKQREMIATMEKFRATEVGRKGKEKNRQMSWEKTNQIMSIDFAPVDIAELSLCIVSLVDLCLNHGSFTFFFLGRRFLCLGVL